MSGAILQLIFLQGYLERHQGLTFSFKRLNGYAIETFPILQATRSPARGEEVIPEVADQ